MTQSAPPGWYVADGDPPNIERFWNGTEWTHDTRQQLAPPVVGRQEVPSRDEWRLGWLLFSFRGRAHRGHFWAGQAVVWGGMLLALIVGGFDSESNTSDVAAFVFIAVFLVLVWIALAIAVKRWHDRDKSGWWHFIILIPFGGLWYFIECGFLEGTQGPNQYGGHRGPPN